MSQSTSSASNDRAVLFQRAGELSEFAELLTDLAMPFDECTTALPAPDQLEGARLVILSGKQLLESDPPNLSLWPRTIAVIDDSSRSLVTHLSRIGVSMVIRRPIHPRTLRLLFLHEIYRGPERRDQQRILIGHPVRIGSGFFKSHATLLELSPSGARIELANAPKIGSEIRIVIGKDLTQTRPLRLQARIIRSIRASKENNRTESEIGVAILDSSLHARTIQRILDRFTLGPSMWMTERRQREPELGRAAPDSSAKTTDNETSSEVPLAQFVPSPSEVEAAIDDPLLDEDQDQDSLTLLAQIETVTAESAAPRELDCKSEEPEVDNGIPDDSENPSIDSSERRAGPRIPYDRRVVALSQEAARILVGRDLSLGGMRVVSTPLVAVGDVLRVALHSGAETEPLVVLARALRDDGDDGLLLTFNDLSTAQQERLEEIIAGGLLVHAADDPLEGPSLVDEPIIVAEMLVSVDQESDPRIESHGDSIV